jgi:hypothetical protein
MKFLGFAALLQPKEEILMPADLKKVAREMQDLFDSLDYHNSDIDLPAVEFILQTFASEVRAQAWGDAADKLWQRFKELYTFGGAEPHAAVERIVEDFRRRASGKGE